MTSQPRHASFYNSANTTRYVAKVLTVSELAEFADDGVAVWLYLRSSNHNRDATTDASVHVARRQQVSPFSAVLRWR